MRDASRLPPALLSWLYQHNCRELLGFHLSAPAHGSGRLRLSGLHFCPQRDGCWGGFFPPKPFTFVPRGPSPWDSPIHSFHCQLLTARAPLIDLPQTTAPDPFQSLTHNPRPPQPQRPRAPPHLGPRPPGHAPLCPLPAAAGGTAQSRYPAVSSLLPIGRGGGAALLTANRNRACGRGGTSCGPGRAVPAPLLAAARGLGLRRRPAPRPPCRTASSPETSSSPR